MTDVKIEIPKELWIPRADPTEVWYHEPPLPSTRYIRSDLAGGEVPEEVREAVKRLVGGHAEFILNQLRILEKYQLTCCNAPGETRDDSISRFALGMTRSALEKWADVETILTHLKQQEPEDVPAKR